MRINKISLIIALIHWALTFFTDKLIFTVSPLEEPFNYIICKILLGALLIALWSFFLSIKNSPRLKRLIKLAIPYLIPIAAVLIFKLPQGFLSNDEKLIFEEAKKLASYKWFYYLTTYYYIICMMLIPSFLGPILFKVGIQVFTCAYSVLRMEELTKSKWSRLMYLPFLLPPVLAYTTSAHRIPVYFLLYLFMLYVLFMDKISGKAPSTIKSAALILLSAILTQWRTEGIYLSLLVPILLIIAYPFYRTRKYIFQIFVISILCQYLVSIPQYGLIPNRMNDQAENRMGPFYAYTITNMWRNGLDKEKNAEDIEKVGRYLDLAVLDAINQDLKDINYEDVLILYYPGYTGLKENTEAEDYEAYTEGCRNIFLNNPDVFIRTRIGAFNYAALPYRIEWKEEGAKGFAYFLISIVKTISYNLYIPFTLLLVFLLFSIIKREYYTFFMCMGLCCHAFIVFILAPASYFKYYFPIYMTVYFWTIMTLSFYLYSKKPLKLTITNDTTS